MKNSKKKPTSTKKSAKTSASTKTARVNAMLRAGATPEALMKATGWQAHSLRGFISAVARKKLGLDVKLTDGKYTATGGVK